MHGKEMKLWRVERGIKQKDLAAALNVSVVTMWNWENERCRMPIDIVAQLEAVALSMVARKPVAGKVDAVCFGRAKERPDLKLYKYSHSDRPQWTKDAEHPESLGFQREADGKPLPWSILDSDAYLAALQRHRMNQG